MHIHKIDVQAFTWVHAGPSSAGRGPEEISAIDQTPSPGAGSRVSLMPRILSNVTARFSPSSE